MKLLIIMRIRVMTKKINKTYAIECHGIDTLQEYVDEFVKHKKVVSVSVTVTEGPCDFFSFDCI